MGHYPFLPKTKGDPNLHITTKLPDHPTACVVAIFRPFGKVTYPNFTSTLRHTAQQPARYLDLLTFCHIQRRVSSLCGEVHPTCDVGDLILEHEYLHDAFFVRVYIFTRVNLVSRHYIFVHGGVQLTIHRRNIFNRLEVAAIFHLQSITTLLVRIRQCGIRLFSRRKRNLASVIRGRHLFLVLKLYLGAIRRGIFFRLYDVVLLYLYIYDHPHDHATSEVTAIVVVGIAIFILEIVAQRAVSRIDVRVEENWGAQSISRKDRELLVKVRIERHPTASDSIFYPQCRDAFRRVFATIRIDVCDRVRRLKRIQCHIFRRRMFSRSLLRYLNPKTIIRNEQVSILRVTIFARRHRDRQAGRIHEHLRC